MLRDVTPRSYLLVIETGRLLYPSLADAEKSRQCGFKMLTLLGWSLGTLVFGVVYQVPTNQARHELDLVISYLDLKMSSDP